MSFRWFDAMVILLAGVEQVIASDSVFDTGCHDDQCSFDEICCSDGLCCSSFERNWFGWVVMVTLLFTILMTCLCLPRLSSWNGDIEPVQYHILTTGQNSVLHTKQYKLQPQTPQQHYPLATESWPQEYQPYRYERLVQQSLPERSYPEPSAPPDPSNP